MVQKGTFLKVIDSCGVRTVKIFHLYRGGFRKVSHIGNFIKCSVKTTKPNNFIKKKTKTKAIVIHTKKEFIKKDGSYIKFFINSSILLKKRMTPRGKELFGPVIYNIKRKKFINSFAGII
jgi:large subunit ribosomal protein L14